MKIFTRMLGGILFLSMLVAPALAPSPAGAASGPPYTVQSNVAYCTLGGVALLADVYTPVQPTASMPLVLYVHGGGWRAGDKANIVTGTNKDDALNALTSNGYVVASVNYRLAPAYPFPAMVQDVKCAVRYFRANASLYGIDPTRIGAWGSSAGGHIVGLLGTTDASAGWDVGPYLDQSSRVEAVVNWFGPQDVSSLYTEAVAKGNTADESNVLDAFGSSDPSVLAVGSPVTYVTADDAPTLTQQGVIDNQVYPDQASELNGDLVAAGVATRLVWVQNAGHEFQPVPPGATISPSLVQIAQQMVSFFNAYVKNNPNPQPQ
jgi:acetyl esterase/lipase